MSRHTASDFHQGLKGKHFIVLVFFLIAECPSQHSTQLALQLDLTDFSKFSGLGMSGTWTHQVGEQPCTRHGINVGRIEMNIFELTCGAGIQKEKPQVLSGFCNFPFSFMKLFLSHSNKKNINLGERFHQWQTSYSNK